MLTRFALRSRSFGIFAAGNLVSQTGEWMTWVALNWAVFELTGSALYLAVINACRLVPAFILSVPAGVLADRTDRRKMLIALQFGTMLSTFAVGYMLASETPFWLLAAVVTFRSSLMAAVIPIRNALIPNLVAETQIASAVAIDTTARNLARIAGPATAGILLAVTEVEVVFVISASSIAAVILSLFIIHPESAEREAVSTDMRTDVREAALYVKNSPSVQSLLILAIAPLAFAFPYTAMMPLFANDLLRLGPEGLGILLSVAAAGALSGSAYLSLGGEAEGTGKWLVSSTIALGAFLILFMFTETLLAAAVMMFLVGLASAVYRTTSRVALQTRVPDRLRGRILSIALMDRGFMPLGAILIGAVAEWTGAFSAGVFMGAGCIAVTLAILAARRQIWRL